MIASLAGLAALFAAGVLAASPFQIDSHDDLGNKTGETPGILPGPPPDGSYYRWNTAVFWSSFINYWRITGDAQYKDLVTQALLGQCRPNDDNLPLNWTYTMGNVAQNPVFVIKVVNSTINNVGLDQLLHELSPTTTNMVNGFYRRVLREHIENVAFACRVLWSGPPDAHESEEQRSDVPLFEYIPLRSAHNFRILRLKKLPADVFHDGELPLHGSLIEASIESPPEYYALSYT
ncbi:hypothetical protein OQA88_13202 [Cercophora sp. LCS_1]